MRNRACGNKNIYIYIYFLKKKPDKLPPDEPLQSPIPIARIITKKKKKMVKESFAPIG